MLRAYQAGRCFYCGEAIPEGDGDVDHVDHVVPRQFLLHDEVWNLVLAHGFCNRHKADKLPPRPFVGRLVARNEGMVASNHSLRRDVVARLGATPGQQARATLRAWEDARLAIPYEWTGLPGLEPSPSAFYKGIVRGLGE